MCMSSDSTTEYSTTEYSTTEYCIEYIVRGIGKVCYSYGYATRNYSVLS